MVERDRSGARDPEPGEHHEIGHLFEAKQSLQRIDIAPFGRSDCNEHDDHHGNRDEPGQQPDQQQQAADELHARGEGRQELRGGNPPLPEILDHPGQEVQLLPTRPHEHPADDDPDGKRPRPGEIAGDDPGPVVEDRDQQVHAGTFVNSLSWAFSDWGGRYAASMRIGGHRGRQYRNEPIIPASTQARSRPAARAAASASPVKQARLQQSSGKVLSATRASSRSDSSASSDRYRVRRSGRQIAHGTGTVALTTRLPAATSSRRCQACGTSKASVTQRSEGSAVKARVSHASGGRAMSAAAGTGSMSGASQASPSSHSKRAISVAAGERAEGAVDSRK